MKLAILFTVALLHCHAHAAHSAWGSILPMHFDGHNISATIKPAEETQQCKGEPIEFVCIGDSIHAVWLKNKNVEPLVFNVGHIQLGEGTSRARIFALNKDSQLCLNVFDNLAVKGTVFIKSREGRPAENWVFAGMLTPISSDPEEKK